MIYLHVVVCMHIYYCEIVHVCHYHDYFLIDFPNSGKDGPKAPFAPEGMTLQAAAISDSVY